MPYHYAKINVYSSSIDPYTNELIQFEVGRRFLFNGGTYNQLIALGIGPEPPQYINYAVAQTALKYGNPTATGYLTDYMEIYSVSNIVPNTTVYDDVVPCYSKNTIQRISTLFNGSNKDLDYIDEETYETQVFGSTPAGEPINWVLQNKLNEVLPGYPFSPSITYPWILQQDRMDGNGYWSTATGGLSCTQIAPQCYSYYLCKWNYNPMYAGPVGGEVLRVSFDRPVGGGGGVPIFDGGASEGDSLSCIKVQYASGSLSNASVPSKRFLNYAWSRSSQMGEWYDYNAAYMIFGNVMSYALPISGLMNRSNVPCNFFTLIGGKGKG